MPLEGHCMDMYNEEVNFIELMAQCICKLTREWDGAQLANVLRVLHVDPIQGPVALHN